MFGKREACLGSGKHMDTIIGKASRFKGSLEVAGMLRIDGYFEGEITTQGDVVVGEGGVVRAAIKAKNCTVAGEINGDIVVEKRLEITSSGKVVGNIQSEQLVIGEGAIFCGKCEMQKIETVGSATCIA